VAVAAALVFLAKGLMAPRAFTLLALAAVALAAHLAAVDLALLLAALMVAAAVEAVAAAAVVDRSEQSVSSGLARVAAHHHSHQLTSEHKLWNTLTSNYTSKSVMGSRMSTQSLRTTSSWLFQTSI
jgi:hypothetical protein